MLKDQFKISRGSQSTGGFFFFFFLSGFHMFSIAFNLVWLIVIMKLQPTPWGAGVSNFRCLAWIVLSCCFNTTDHFGEIMLFINSDCPEKWKTVFFFLTLASVANLQRLCQKSGSNCCFFFLLQGPTPRAPWVEIKLSAAWCRMVCTGVSPQRQIIKCLEGSN